MNVTGKNILDRMSLGQKLGILPVLFIVGVLISITIMAMQLDNQKQDAMQVHLMSRTRILMERALNKAIMSTEGHKVDVNEERKLSFDTLKGLRDGGAVIAFTGSSETIELPAAVNRSIKDQLTANIDLMANYFVMLDALLAMPRDSAGLSAKVEEVQAFELKLDAQLRDNVQAFTIASEEKINAALTRQISVSLALIVFSCFIAFVITRRITQPMQKLVAMAEGISNGNLRQQKLEVRSTDEIGRLSSSFNTMLDGLRDLAIQNIAVAKNLSVASAEVLASVQQQAAATKQQAAAVQQTTTTMEEVGQSGAQIADRARQVSLTATEAFQAGSTGIDAVQNTNRTMIAIREQVEAVAEKIVTLSERTQAIGEIIATVTDIAEQSNLLALNAAIEAAAAGEQGRSFSVVANEIKNLAELSKESTVRVRSILGDIQSGINSSVMLTEEAVKRVETGKNLAEVSEKTIVQMSSTSKESTTAFQQIVGATSQQQIGFEQITLALRSITSGAEQTAASNNQLERAAMSLNSLGQQLQNTVERYAV
ncbi:MAG: methyl-accepting chemotaxis protein [Proteobacteria bacterium]|nr:MAG: methyl-accepting chemotaxis protein [Pseudomonadota bacterium]